MGVHGGYYSSGISGSSGGPFTTYTSGAETYRVHTFLSSGTFKVDYPVRCDVLIVGGGGGAPQAHAGGGGGGGVIHLEGVLLGGNCTVTVGAGGATGEPGNNGTNSTLLEVDTNYSQSSYTGGGGIYYSDGQPSNVGVANSGGGSTTAPVAGTTPPSGSGWPAETTYYGDYDGGTGGGAWYGSGGAGAGANGSAGVSTNIGGNGGAGIQIDIDGNNYYWAGGGGGYGRYGNGNPGDGGVGGGGGGRSNYGAVDAFSPGGGSCKNEASTDGNGQTNTGGGAGAGDQSGRTGGSGIVIVRLGAL
jgi:hypothetical protein